MTNYSSPNMSTEDHCSCNHTEEQCRENSCICCTH